MANSVTFFFASRRRRGNIVFCSPEDVFLAITRVISVATFHLVWMIETSPLSAVASKHDMRFHQPLHQCTLLLCLMAPRVWFTVYYYAWCTPLTVWPTCLVWKISQSFEGARTESKCLPSDIIFFFCDAIDGNKYHPTWFSYRHLPAHYESRITSKVP